MGSKMMFDELLKELNSRGFTLVPLEPSLAMLDDGWGICGTDLSSMQPNADKHGVALEGYKAMLEAAKKVFQFKQNLPSSFAATEFFLVSRVGS